MCQDTKGDPEGEVKVQKLELKNEKHLLLPAYNVTSLVPRFPGSRMQSCTTLHHFLRVRSYTPVTYVEQ